MSASPMPSTVQIPLTIDLTQTDLPPDTSVYAYVIGLVQTPTSSDFYYVNNDLVPADMQTGDNTQPAGGANYPNAWADYSIPLTVGSTTAIDLAQFATYMPYLGTGTAAFSGRVYLSVGSLKLPFTVVADASTGVVTGYTAPVVDANGPGALCLVDWIEFSWDADGNFNGNTTQVDQFGFVLMLDGTPGGMSQGAIATARADVMARVDALPAPFTVGTLTVPVPDDSAESYPKGTDYLRAMSPKTLTGPASYSGPVASYFTDTIADWYTAWESAVVLVTDLSTGTYTGLVTDGVLNFYAGTYTVSDIQSDNPPPVAFSMTWSSETLISSVDVWQCNNTLATGSAAQQNVGKILAAAFNRGVVSDSLDDTNCADSSSGFYPSGAVFNSWAQLFHELNTNGLAYGFPYDDVCNQNPTVALAGTTSVTITLGNFNS